MTTESETLVTQDLIERKGKFSEPKVAPPIALSDIRKWAIAVYWPDEPPPMYWDEDYAKTTRHGSLWTSTPSRGRFTGSQFQQPELRLMGPESEPAG